MQAGHTADAAPEPYVLVVDDDRALTLMLGATLAAAGFAVDVANDGAEALEVAEVNGPPEVAIVDGKMPVLDGYGFIAEFRKARDCADVPVILATDLGDVHKARRQIEGMGIVLLMPKPLDIETLLTAVGAVSRTRRLRQRRLE